jgi:hypothetical protein
MPFFAEIDLSTEPLHRLVDKIAGYIDLARHIGHIWPVLFIVQSSRREQHLHQRLTEHGNRWPIATTVRTHSSNSGPGSGDASPAGKVWWPHRHDGDLVRLSDLAPSSPSQ